MSKKTPVEFSKKIIIGISFYLAILNIFVFVAVIIKNDLSPLAYLIPGAFSIAATCFGFYFWKAKAENRIKLMKENNMPIDEPKDVFTDGEEAGYGFYDDLGGLENG